MDCSEWVGYPPINTVKSASERSGLIPPGPFLDCFFSDFSRYENVSAVFSFPLESSSLLVALYSDTAWG